jgi:hypothetical protein
MKLVLADSTGKVGGIVARTTRHSKCDWGPVAKLSGLTIAKLTATLLLTISRCRGALARRDRPGARRRLRVRWSRKTIELFFLKDTGAGRAQLMAVTDGNSVVVSPPTTLVDFVLRDLSKWLRRIAAREEFYLARQSRRRPTGRR